MKKPHPEEVPPPGSVSQSALVAQEDRRQEHWMDGGQVGGGRRDAWSLHASLLAEVRPTVPRRPPALNRHVRVHVRAHVCSPQSPFVRRRQNKLAPPSPPF